MTYNKSHFRFTRGQRNGIFLLFLIVITLQCVYFFTDKTTTVPEVDEPRLAQFQRELDSLKLLAISDRIPKLFPFNPNFISDYKGYTLGMSPEEIDRLHRFRAQDQWINSAVQFQAVTKISDSFLAAISPYFKFPEWVTQPRSRATFTKDHKPLSFEQKIDLNTATASQLQRVNGIGRTLSQRIIRFRDSFDGGFIADVQLQDVYGLSSEVIERLTDQFTVKSPRVVSKINLNTATVDQLVTIQHIDYPLAHEIVNARILREGFKSLDELTKVKGFPTDKFEIIELYLTLE